MLTLCFGFITITVNVNSSSYHTSGKLNALANTGEKLSLDISIILYVNSVRSGVLCYLR